MILPMRNRTNSDPDYDIPRPHRFVNSPKQSLPKSVLEEMQRQAINIDFFCISFYLLLSLISFYLSTDSDFILSIDSVNTIISFSSAPYYYFFSYANFLHQEIISYVRTCTPICLISDLVFVLIFLH